MNRNQKKYISLFIAVASITTFLLIGPKKSRNEIAEEVIKKQQIKKVISKKTAINKNKQKISRSIASIPPAKSPSSKREVVGKVTNLNNVRIINKENKNWKEIYSKNFLRMLGETKVKDFKVKLKKSILKVDNNIGQQLEHVVVSYIKPDGNPLSFEALIDSQTGSVVQTWNQTRYEVNNPVKLNSSGKKFYQD